MDMVNKFGKMAPNMKVTGDLIKHADTVSSGMLMEISLKENGLMIKLMVMVFTFIRMVLDMKVNGKMIFSTGSEKKYGQITVSMRVTTQKVRNMEKVFISGKMDQCTMETGLKTELKALENTNGKMAVCILENGKITICMVKVFIPGLMEGDMKVNTKWIRNMALEFTSGQTDVYMKVIGSTASNTEQENTYCKTELLR